MVKPIIDPPKNPKRQLYNQEESLPVPVGILPMPPYKSSDSMQVRRQVFFDWCQAVQKNSRYMLPLGMKKRWWMLFKSEHPFTSRVSMEGIKNG